MILTNYPFVKYELKQLFSHKGEINGIVLHSAEDPDKSVQLKNNINYRKLEYGYITTQYLYYSKNKTG